MPASLPIEYDGIQGDYAAISVGDDLYLTMLDIAEREGLLERRGSTPDGTHYAVLCNDKRLLLTSDEVPGFVLALFVMAGKDLRPVAYRTGLVPSA